jgi:hypothetical protein
VSFYSCLANGTILKRINRTLPCVFNESGLYEGFMSSEEMEEIKRHFGVVAESLRSDIQQIAEGHAVLGMSYRVSLRR